MTPDQQDLRLVTAIARHGGMRSAAAALGVHAATAYRRLAALEAAFGQTLFERMDGRLIPTAAGQDIVETAETVDAALAGLSRRLDERHDRLSGDISIATTDTLLPILTAALKPFAEAHPAVTPHIVISNAMADLSRGGAMVAFRPTMGPPEALIGVKVAEFEFAIYAAAETLPRWISPDDSLASIPSARWLADHHDLSDALRINSLWAAGESCAAGLGRALLPDYVARRFPIRRLSPAPTELRSIAWLLYHPDNRRNLRVRRFVQQMAPRLREALLREVD
jgi:DNA-binding transcriptional LysR family regulator